MATSISNINKDLLHWNVSGVDTVLAAVFAPHCLHVQTDKIILQNLKVESSAKNCCLHKHVGFVKYLFLYTKETSTKRKYLFYLVLLYCSFEPEIQKWDSNLFQWRKKNEHKLKISKFKVPRGEVTAVLTIHVLSSSFHRLSNQSRPHCEFKSTCCLQSSCLQVVHLNPMFIFR